VGDTGSAGLKLGLVLLVLGERDNELLVIDGVLESKQACGRG
jgi:hypothetical protein